MPKGEVFGFQGNQGARMTEGAGEGTVALNLLATTLGSGNLPTPHFPLRQDRTMHLSPRLSSIIHGHFYHAEHRRQRCSTCSEIEIEIEIEIDCSALSMSNPSPRFDTRRASARGAVSFRCCTCQRAFTKGEHLMVCRRAAPERKVMCY